MPKTLIGAGEVRSYDPALFSPLFAIEDRHFWFRTRNQLITSIIPHITAPLVSGYRVLEVGCGTGVVLRALESACDRGSVVGMDLFIEGLRYARLRTQCGLVQGDMHTAPFAETFDVIGLFDVLEHLPNDPQVLHDLHAMLVPGGTLLLTVPARMSLWSYFDEASHHCRRYERDGLARKLEDAGYEVQYLTPIMATLFPMIWVGRRVARLLKRRQGEESLDSDAMARSELRIVPVVNEALAWLLRQESRLVARRKQLWIGTSFLAIARKVDA